MEFFTDLLRTFCLTLLGLAAAFLVLRFVLGSIHIVNQGEQAVVERLGRFIRVSGPGMIWVTAGLEQIARYIETRTTGEVYPFNDVWFRGYLPFTIELALSYSLNLRRLPFALQRDLAYYTRDEWQTLTKAHINRVLQDILPRFDYAQLIGQEPAFREQFENALSEQLQGSLAPYGMTLSAYHGTELKAVRLPEPLRESLTNITRTDVDAHTRIALLDDLKARYPDVSEAMLLSLASLVTGQQLGAAQMLPPIIFSATAPERPPALPDNPPLALNRPEPPAPDKPDDAVWRVLKLPPAADESKDLPS